MNLRDRLEWAHNLTQKRRESRTPEQEGTLEPLPWGEVLETPFGRCVRIMERYPLDHCHGQTFLNSVFGRQPYTFGALDRGARVPFALVEELCFLDTETTGLAGGTGTVPFLIGIGYFSESSFVVEQFFARDFDEERPVLYLATQLLQRRSKWVSYNGKTFDVQLLNQRLLFHRMGQPLSPAVHIDLLFSVRRFWKWLGEHSLARAEQKILGVQRSADVPSYMVPFLYFDYLRNRDPWPLAPVFEHNRLDILSLVGLLDACARFLERPESVPADPDLRQAGRLLQQRGRIEQAIRVTEEAVARATNDRVRKDLLVELARLYKRQNRWARAAELWHQALKLPGFSLEPYVELAKYYEHQARELRRAEHYTRRALDQLRIVAPLRVDPKWKTHEQDLRKRLERLLRKQGKLG